jgi:hypothetical protein
MSVFYKRLDQETGAGQEPGGAMSERQKWTKKGSFRSANKRCVWISFRNSGGRKNIIKCDENSLVRHRKQAYFVPYDFGETFRSARSKAESRISEDTRLSAYGAFSTTSPGVGGSVFLLYLIIIALFLLCSFNGLQAGERPTFQKIVSLKIKVNL